MGAYSRVTKAFREAERIPVSPDSRFILISDCHRGTGTSADNFLKNENLYYAAAEYYYEKGFTYIELGDGDELWENRSIARIAEIHGDVFRLLNQYGKEERLYLLYGNHDMVKRKRKTPVFGDAHFREGLILEDKQSGKELRLLHGHQADFLNSVLWRLARFLVRYLWKPVESIGVLDPTSAARNNEKKKRVEEILTDWAQKENHIVIAGHTHRPMLGTKESPYFNTGSCVHPGSITAIELEHRCLKLVKWTVKTRKDRTLYVEREELAGPMCIDEY